MNRKTYSIAAGLAIFLFACLPARAQQSQQATQTNGRTPSTNDIVLASQTLSWMVGNWQGDGVQEGVTFSTSFQVQSALDDAVLIAKRTTNGGYKDEMLLGFDKGSNHYVATIFDSQKHIALFSCDVVANQVTCNQITAPAGYQSRRTFRQIDANSVSFVIEGGKSGAQLEKKVEVTYRRQS